MSVIPSFRFGTDLTLRGKAALMALGAPLAALPAIPGTDATDGDAGWSHKQTDRRPTPIAPPRG